MENHRVGFQLGAYDPACLLIIDPELVAAFSFGGSGNDVGRGIASDAEGNFIITGNTFSADFPTMNAVDDTFGGGVFFGDAFVTKINPETEQILYSTYLGGTADDSGFAVTVDGQGNAFVLGTAGSNDFPTMNALQPDFGGGSDAFLACLDTDGALVFSTFLGGNGFDEPRDIVRDSDGNLCFTGSTTSTNFPTQDPLQANLAGGRDAFVSQIDPAGDTLLYSTYLGGDMEDFGTGIALDSEGNVYIGGQTTSTDLATDDAFQTTLGGSADAFVLKFSPDTNEISWATCLGGSGRDRANGLDVDGQGRAYVAGETASADFPLHDPEQDAFGGVGNFQGDAFVSVLSPGGETLERSTFIGGRNDNVANFIVVDPDVVILGGTTFSPIEDFQAAFPNVSQSGELGNGDTWLAEAPLPLAPAGPVLLSRTPALAPGQPVQISGGSGTEALNDSARSPGRILSTGATDTSGNQADVLLSISDLLLSEPGGFDLQLTKMVDTDEALEGSRVTFTVMVRNIGDEASGEFWIIDRLGNVFDSFNDGLSFPGLEENGGLTFKSGRVTGPGAKPCLNQRGQLDHRLLLASPQLWTFLPTHTVREDHDRVRGLRRSRIW